MVASLSSCDWPADSLWRMSDSVRAAQASISSREWPVTKARVSRTCLKARLPTPSPATRDRTPERAASRQPAATRAGGLVMNWYSVEARAIRVSDLRRMVGARPRKTEAVWGARPRQWWDSSWLRTV